MMLLVILWLVANLLPVSAPPQARYVTDWDFVVLQGTTKTESTYNLALDLEADVRMPIGHPWICERMPLSESNDGSLEQGTFVCANGDSMFTVASVCATNKEDSNQSASMLLEQDKPKVLFTVMCRTVKAPVQPARGKSI